MLSLHKHNNEQQIGVASWKAAQWSGRQFKFKVLQVLFSFWCIEHRSISCHIWAGHSTLGLCMLHRELGRRTKLCAAICRWPIGCRIPSLACSKLIPQWAPLSCHLPSESKLQPTWSKSELSLSYTLDLIVHRWKTAWQGSGDSMIIKWEKHAQVEKWWTIQRCKWDISEGTTKVDKESTQVSLQLVLFWGFDAVHLPSLGMFYQRRMLLVQLKHTQRLLPSKMIIIWIRNNLLEWYSGCLTVFKHQRTIAEHRIFTYGTI